MKRNASPCRRFRDPLGSSGQSLAEMAFVLPILLLLVFGIIEMSLAWRTSQIVTNVTREGARLAVLPDTVDPDVVKQRVLDGLAASGLAIDENAEYVSLDCSNDDDDGSICTTSGDQTLVQTDYPYQFRLLGPLVELAGGQGGRFGQINISSTSTMRRE